MTTISNELDQLVPAWLTLPEVAERLELPVKRARQLLKEHQLVAVRRGEGNALSVPAAFLDGDQILKGLPGTLTLLADNRFTEEESVRWLFTPDDSLPGTPVQALAQHRGTEVRRRAHALGF
ncbi:MAG TPA: Rv2175c family DNA-binding protein [Actinocrinis sp.]|uniref:Rv2175c family DNA-binding protein n=1 Tax=Actinocrinis sp. TaxID=1920516 RepID=UPI002DDD07EE|nr:Rv2175c family DNA-binding protein [Actinocrinis sp.]HEV2345245.1 Rv2175c family DNA-binding protein [Actinocrinis sp.]